MAACRSTLQEAARWHQLAREADAGFAGGDMTQVCVGGGAYFWLFCLFLRVGVGELWFGRSMDRRSRLGLA